MNRYFFSLMLFIITFLSFITNWYSELSIALIVMLLIMLLDKMGKGIVLRETTALLYVFTCLVIPLLGYTYYTIDDPMAKLFVKYMPIAKRTYFDFSLPAISSFCLAITLPIGKRQSSDEGYVLNEVIKQIKVRVNFQTGILMMGFGILISLIINILPVSLQFFATLFYFTSFSGLLYVYFSSDIKYKKVIIIAFLAFIFGNALNTGMFTIVAYMSVTIFSFFLLGNKTSLFKKVILIVFAISFMVVLQNVKISYRKMIWQSDYDGSKVELFTNLFIEKLQRGNALIEKEALFPIYYRTNQGFNVALVMQRIPQSQPFDNGNLLFTALISSFVPRFLWADKPIAGGKFNMKYYAGKTLSASTSMNVGPLGEAYGSFGIRGGIAYMFFLGLFIRWFYSTIFKIGKRIPLILCWIPVLFYQITYSAETDTLQIINSFLKTAFFIWLIYKVLPNWLGIRNEYIRYRKNVIVTPA